MQLSSQAAVVAILIIAGTVAGCGPNSTPEPNSMEELIAVNNELLSLKCLPPDLRSAAEKANQLDEIHPELLAGMIQAGRQYLELYKEMEDRGAYREGCPTPR